jgi:ferredoxin-NADP reductase
MGNASSPESDEGLSADVPKSTRASTMLDSTTVRQANGLRVTLLACFCRETEIQAERALTWLHQHCPKLTVHFNLKHRPQLRPLKPFARREALPSYSHGRVTSQLLINLLPQTDLACVCICGDDTFVQTIKEQYVTLGVPRSMIVDVL